MKKEFLIEAIDFIENFDEKNVTVAVLFPIGRSGSFLLQSLFDNHEEVLMLPSVFVFIEDWENLKIFSNKPKQIVENFFKEGSINQENGTETNHNLYKLKDRIGPLLIDVLESIKINRKNFVLAVHFTYAYIENKKLAKIKNIFIHHHYTREITSYDMIKGSILDYINNYIYLKKDYFDDIKSDFPKLKLLFTIRDYFENFYSFLNFIKKENNALDLSDFFKRMYLSLFAYIDFIENVLETKNFEYKIITLKSIHNETEIIMRQLSSFLEITYTKSLLESTFEGKVWKGNSSKGNIGISKNITFNNWEKELTNEMKNFCNELFKSVSAFIENTIYTETENIVLNKLFKEEEKGLFKSIFKNTKSVKFIETFSTEVKIWSEIYIIIRKNLFLRSYNIKNKELLDKNLSLDNSFFYKDIKIKIQYKEIPEILDSTSYNIYLQPWIYTSLTNRLVKHINKEVDQIWVMSNFTKQNYIDSGVIENKINLIPYGVNTTLFKKKEAFFKNNTESSFKFLYYSFFDSEQTIELLLDSFCEEFKDTKNVTLVIYKEEYSRYNDQEQKYLQELIIKYKNNYNLKSSIDLVFSITLNILFIEEAVVNLFEQCNCYVYPYYEESDCIPLLQAMSCELPVITTNGGSALDFCNNENSFLVDSKLVDSGITTFLDMELVHEHQYFEPDKEHLKKLMRYVYENQEEAKVKGKKARETIVNNFTWEHTMNKIDESIEELRDKPIVRFNIDTIKAEYLKNANIFLDNKEYDKAELELEILTKYESNNQDYLYKLGICYYHQEKYDKAIEFLSEAMDLGLLNYEILNLIAYSLEKTGEDETAQLYYDKANEFL